MDTVMGFLVLAAVAGFVTYDAFQLRAKETEVLGASDLQPVLWGIGVFALLIVFLPWYLVVRNNRKKELLGVCPTCFRLVDRGATVCPYCRYPLPQQGIPAPPVFPAASAPSQVTAPGWLPDPTGRHEFRYWDGGAWTSHVADGGVPSVEAR